MTVDLLSTVVHTALNRAQKRPLELLSLLCGAGAMGMFLVSTTLLTLGKSNTTTTTTSKTILTGKSEDVATTTGSDDTTGGAAQLPT
jgi:hypothetical protein